MSDHHRLFRVIGKKIGLSEDIVMRDIVRGLVMFYREDFEGIKNFLKERLG